MLKNQSNALHPDRLKILTSFYLNFKSNFDFALTVSFIQIRSIFKLLKMGLLHSFRCKNEDQNEYYECWFQILFDEFVNEDFKSQLVDLSFLYIVYFTMPSKLIKINVSQTILEKIARLTRKCEENHQTEFLLLVRNLLAANAFVPSTKHGLTSVILNKNGKIKKENDSDSVKMIFEIEELNWKENLMDLQGINCFLDDSSEYLKEKKEYFSLFVQEDQDLKIVYNPKKKKILKTVESELSVFDESAVGDFFKIAEKLT